MAQFAAGVGVGGVGAAGRRDRCSCSPAPLHVIRPATLLNERSTRLPLSGAWDVWLGGFPRGRMGGPAIRAARLGLDARRRWRLRPAHPPFFATARLSFRVYSGVSCGCLGRHWYSVCMVYSYFRFWIWRLWAGLDRETRLGIGTWHIPSATPINWRPPTGGGRPPFGGEASASLRTK